VKYFVPMALQHLEKHPVAPGDLYPGDLLMAVASLGDLYWSDHPNQRQQLVHALHKAVPRFSKLGVPEDVQKFLQRILKKYQHL